MSASDETGAGPAAAEPGGVDPGGSAPNSPEPAGSAPAGSVPVGDGPVGDGPVGDGPVGDGPAAATPTGEEQPAAEVPAKVRKLDSPAALALAHLAEVFEELQTVLRCCERLMAEMPVPRPGPDPLMEALWTTAVLSYARCFAEGPSGSGLSKDDLTTTGLEGDLADWHDVLLRVREHYADPKANPREHFSVGVAQDAAEKVTGVALTSTRQPDVDEVTVRQTGALAYALYSLVDKRISEQQQVVFNAVSDLSTVELRRLPELDVVAAQEEPDGS